MEIILLVAIVFGVFVAVNMAVTGRSVGEAAKTTWAWNAAIGKRNLGRAGKIAGAAIKIGAAAAKK